MRFKIIQTEDGPAVRITPDNEDEAIDLATMSAKVIDHQKERLECVVVPLRNLYASAGGYLITSEIGNRADVRPQAAADGKTDEPPKEPSGDPPGPVHAAGERAQGTE